MQGLALMWPWGGIGVLCEADCYLKGTGLVLGVLRRPKEGLG